MEFDEPHNLLSSQKEDGYFSKMVAQTGVNESLRLAQTARECHIQRHKGDRIGTVGAAEPTRTNSGTNIG